MDTRTLERGTAGRMPDLPRPNLNHWRGSGASIYHGLADWTHARGISPLSATYRAGYNIAQPPINTGTPATY